MTKPGIGRMSKDKDEVLMSGKWFWIALWVWSGFWFLLGAVLL